MVGIFSQDPLNNSNQSRIGFRWGLCDSWPSTFNHCSFFPCLLHPDVLSKLQFPLGYVLSHLWAFTLSLPMHSTVLGT